MRIRVHCCVDQPKPVPLRNYRHGKYSKCMQMLYICPVTVTHQMKKCRKREKYARHINYSNFGSLETSSVNKDKSQLKQLNA